MKHIMLDLETWGTEPGCDIRSIGACVFYPDSGHIGGFEDGVSSGDKVGNISTDKIFYIAVDNPIIAKNTWSNPEHLGGGYKTLPEYKYPLTRDPRTVQWWSEQSDEAQAAFADPVDLREALRQLTVWIDNIGREGDTDFRKPHERTNIRLWSHGSHFDGPILAAAYRAVGLPEPWHYRAPRDTRTIFDLAGIDDHSAWLAAHPGPLGIPHHALDDAICQARAVCAAYEIIGTWRNAHEEYERDL